VFVSDGVGHCSLLMNVVRQPVVSDEPLNADDRHRVVQFDRTPIMSTYLLAMIVGEYDYVEARDADDVLVRVYTPVGKKEQGQFALNVSELHVATIEAHCLLWLRGVKES